MRRGTLLVFALVLSLPASAERRAPKAAAVGHWAGGALVGGAALSAEGPDHYLLYPADCYTKPPMVEAYPGGERASNFYAHPSVVRAILDVAKAVRRRHRDAPRVPVGELSNRAGGKIPFHRSHQNGLDFDVFFLLRPHAPREPGALGQDPHRIVPVCRDGPNGEPRDPKTGKWRVHRDFAVDWNWALVAEFARRDDVKVVFVGKLLRRKLLAWGKRHAASPEEYEAVRQKAYTPFCRGGDGVGKVSYGGNFCAHDDHIHVRFHCPPGSAACRETKR